MPTQFKALAELCEKLEATRKRSLMVKMVADFIKGLELSEVEPAVSMILGRPLSKLNQKTLEVNWATLSAIIERITEVNWDTFVKLFSKTGDIGSATKSIFEESKIKRQTTLLEVPLTISEVRRSFEEIVESFGCGSREKKERLIATLLSLASPLEAKYIVKIFIGEMRTGFHEGLMEQAVAKAFQMPLEAVQQANMITGDIGEVAAIAKKEGCRRSTKSRFQSF